MGRSPCCEKVGLKKGPWTPEEDHKLLAYIHQHGDGSWRGLPAKAGLQRCGKSCRLRWINYLRPDIKRGKFSLQEEQTIVQLHALLGNRWSVIADHLPKRTDNEIKNFWNTHVKKKLTKMGIDPVTHKPRNGTAGAACSGRGLSHLAQWETARLEAEARLVRQSKLQLLTIAPPSSNLQQPNPHYFNKSSSSGALPRQPPSPLGRMWPNLTETNGSCSYTNNPVTDMQEHLSLNTMEVEGGGSLFQNPNNVNVLLNDVSMSSYAMEAGGGFGFGNGMVNSSNSEQDIIDHNHHIGNNNNSNSFCSESDNGVMRGSCSFGYGGDDVGAKFENNNISTAYWDNIMNMVDASALPLLLHDPAASGSPFLF